MARSLGDRGLAGAGSGSQRRFRFDPANAGNQKDWAGLWFGDNAEAKAGGSVQRNGPAPLGATAKRRCPSSCTRSSHLASEHVQYLH
jgi:hypothetical protein